MRSQLAVYLGLKRQLQLSPAKSPWATGTNRLFLLNESEGVWDDGQANNPYVFPAIGMAAVLTRASAITDDVFLTAAEALAHMTSVQARRRMLHDTKL